MIRSKTIFFFLIAFLAGLLLGIKIHILERSSRPQILINNQAIFVEIVKSPEAITRGLSGREKLEENKGMLFIFDKPGNYPFWMNEMKFSLDFVFINNNIVVDLAENVPYPQNEKEPQVVIAQKDFDKVLEIGAGEANRLKIKVGDTVR